MNIVDEARQVIARESQTVTEVPLYLRVRDALAQLPEMEAHPHSLLRWFEYEIEFLSRNHIDEESRILDWLRSLEIAAAPEVAAVIPLRGNECVMITRYWACPGERLLIPHRDSDVGPPWPEAARTRFRDDMAKLAAHGKVHPYARGYAHMYLSDRTGTVLLNTWSVLKAGTAREQREFLESIDFQIQRRT
ncbi:MAG TPA: hypothetical protein VFP84_13255 [Kofleriaceae bacterium]|nr:hypothetical protein [Kofleriaceae bacterium]